MIFVNIDDEHGHRDCRDVRMFSAICGIGFDELTLTREDFVAIQNMKPGQLEDYFNSVLLVRLNRPLPRIERGGGPK